VRKISFGSYKRHHRTNNRNDPTTKITQHQGFTLKTGCPRGERHPTTVKTGCPRRHRHPTTVKGGCRRRHHRQTTLKIDAPTTTTNVVAHKGCGELRTNTLQRRRCWWRRRCAGEDKVVEKRSSWRRNLNSTPF